MPPDKMLRCLTATRHASFLLLDSPRLLPGREPGQWAQGDLAGVKLRSLDLLGLGVDADLAIAGLGGGVLG